MNELISTGVWGAVQVAVFCLLASVLILVVRQWIRGVVCDLIAIIMALVIVVSVVSWIQTPSWLPLLDFASQSSSRTPIQPLPTNGTKFQDNQEPPVITQNQPIGVVPVEVTAMRQQSTISTRLATFWDRLASTEVASNQTTSSADLLEMVVDKSTVVTARKSTTPELATKTIRMSWLQLIGWVLLSFAMLGITRLAIGLISLRRMVNACEQVDDESAIALLEQLRIDCQIKRNVVLLQNSELQSPATAGWLCPKVILPFTWADWNNAALVSALSHELIHVKHADYLKNLISQVAIALNFFNPLVHWLGRELRFSQELMADHFAAQLSGGREVYLTSMAEMALNQNSEQMGWLAQPFLPTRETFIRRIEMLKKKSPLHGLESKLMKWSFRLALVGLAVLCVGFRLQRSSVVAAQDKPHQVPVVKQKNFAPADVQETLKRRSVQKVETGALNRPVLRKKQNDKRQKVWNKVGYVSRRTKFFLAFDFDQLQQIDQFQELFNKFTNQKNSPLGLLGLNKAKAMTVQVYGFGDLGSRAGYERHSDPSGGVVLHYREPIDVSEIIEAASFDYKYRGTKCYLAKGLNLAFVNELRTLLVGISRSDLESMLDAERSFIDVDEYWKNHLHKPSAIVAAASRTGMEYFSELVAAGEIMNNRTSYMSLFAPLHEETDFVVANIGLEQELVSLNLLTESTDGAAADRVRETAIAFKVIARNFFMQDQKSRAAEFASMFGLPNELAEDLFGKIAQAMDALQIDRKNNTLQMATQLNIPNSQISELLAESNKKYSESILRTASQNNLRQLQFGMLNYESANSYLPWAAANTADSPHPFSWRIAILPMIGQQELYEKYRFDEAWNSPHNQKVTSKMPDLYRHPSDSEDSTNTGYFVITGADTLFPDDRPISVGAIIDGSSNTIAIVEAKRKIHWAKPEDIPYQKGEMKSKLGGFFGSKMLVAFADGSIRTLDLEQNSDQLDKLINPGGFGVAPFKRAIPSTPSQFRFPPTRPANSNSGAQPVRQSGSTFSSQNQLVSPPPNTPLIPKPVPSSDLKREPKSKPGDKKKE